MPDDPVQKSIHVVNPILAPHGVKRLGDMPRNGKTIRWHKKKDGFVLEQWDGGSWIEVYCAGSDL